jgi:hypothetical protein
MYEVSPPTHGCMSSAECPAGLPMRYTVFVPRYTGASPFGQAVERCHLELQSEA